MTDRVKGEMEEDEIKNLKIELTGNKTSRLITGIVSSNIGNLSKKLNKKVVEGKMIHCKPHVPATPPPAKVVNKPVTVVTAKPEEKTNENVSEKETGARKKVIPGLLVD